MKGSGAQEEVHEVRMWERREIGAFLRVLAFVLVGQ